jgi:hypothetical protein
MSGTLRESELGSKRPRTGARFAFSSVRVALSSSGARNLVRRVHLCLPRWLQRAGGSIPLLRTSAAFSGAPMNLTMTVATSFSFELASTPAAKLLYC